MMEDKLSEKICFQLFSENTNAFYGSNGSLFHSVGAPTMKLCSPERVFGLDEEIEGIEEKRQIDVNIL